MLLPWMFLYQAPTQVFKAVISPPKTREREIKAKESNEKPKPPGPRKVGRRRIGKKRKEREKEREGKDSNGEVRQGLGDPLSYILGFPSLFLRVPSSLNGDFIGQ